MVGWEVFLGRPATLQDPVLGMMHGYKNKTPGFFQMPFSISNSKPTLLMSSTVLNVTH